MAEHALPEDAFRGISPTEKSSWAVVGAAFNTEVFGEVEAEFAGHVQVVADQVEEGRRGSNLCCSYRPPLRTTWELGAKFGHAMPSMLLTATLSRSLETEVTVHHTSQYNQLIHTRNR